MFDFLKVSYRSTKKGIEVFPTFVIRKSSDLMIRGGDFYAIWIEERGLWSTDEFEAVELIDQQIEQESQKYFKEYGTQNVTVCYLWDSKSGMMDNWHRYCQKHMPDYYHPLDEKLIFSNAEVKKRDYASKRLNYPLQQGDCPGYEKLISTLYSPEERMKIEWAIGAIVSGDSKKIQKFLVLYGEGGTGKSTIIHIIEQLFAGYTSIFDAKALGSSSNVFALESFKGNPLVAIQHDGDLSRIEDNTRLNSLVSHEYMTVNEKFKSTYSTKFNAFLFMATNKPVKITDGKSGLIRRLIDVKPTGNLLSQKEYDAANELVGFELGAIAYHCLEVYKANKNKYSHYIPTLMLHASNDFYNFVLDSYPIFHKEDGVSLKRAWSMYNTYCDEAKMQYRDNYRVFQEELRNYFNEVKDRFVNEDGTRERSYYSGFKTDKFLGAKPKEIEETNSYILQFDSTESKFDQLAAEYPAQYASSNETPLKAWDKVTTKLQNITTTKLHYVKVPENHIVIDFDIPDENGNKSFELNLQEASKWPATYAELSKSGAGIHLHYIYEGDPKKLDRIYKEHVEIKVFTGNSSLRRKLTLCNNHPIAKINSNLPLKGESKMVNSDVIKSEKGLRALIKRNLDKEIHPNTKPSIEFIAKILDDAYNQGLIYDVTDMRNAVLSFAASSTNQSEYCLKLVSKMRFRSEEQKDGKDDDGKPIVFYDVEVFPNLFLVNWKVEGEGKPVARMINPEPDEIENLIQFRLVGFNCRRYDNHIMYARMMGYTNEELYKLSQRIISGNSRNCFFSEAYNLSYTDVYDFSSKKQSLKKWEIELGIHHQELGLPWDKPVPEERWVEVAEYCDNDVLATEAVFNAKSVQADFLARQILADVAGMTVNDTTNTLTTRIIFGRERKPQSKFNYRNMGDISKTSYSRFLDDVKTNVEYNAFDTFGNPIFPGYEYLGGKSRYREEEIGEGGYVYAEPGMYGHVALLDIASMHPSSIVAENLFGDEYTERFSDILNARIAIKHGDFESARKMLGGKLEPYLRDEQTAGDLAQALKIAINSVYGLTSANFENPFRDPRNKDNIVAKRGELFMVNLKHEVQDRGFTVVHIKTDSIKIADATPEIIDFVTRYGALYGYTFEHEATYDRICLVNNAVYIAKYASVETCYDLYGRDYVDSSPDVCKKNKKKEGKWEATGTQFQIPYVYKTLFSKEEITFEDLCETKSVSTALYLDMNEQLLYDFVHDELPLDVELPTDLMIDPDFEKIISKKFPLVNLEESKLHNLKFVGKVGSFCPIKEGKGGGLLLREKDGKYYAATGSKGYRWMEAEHVRIKNMEADIDRSYYTKLVTDASMDISIYGDLEWFVSDDPYIPPEFVDGHPVYNEVLPFNVKSAS